MNKKLDQLTEITHNKKYQLEKQQQQQQQQKQTIKWEWIQAIIELLHDFLLEEIETWCIFVSSDGRASHAYLALHYIRRETEDPGGESQSSTMFGKGSKVRMRI